MAPLGCQHVGIEDLGAGEEVDALEVEGGAFSDVGDDLGEPFLVETEGCWLAAHAHRTALGGRWKD